jgi:hypothetical protein
MVPAPRRLLRHAVVATPSCRGAVLCVVEAGVCVCVCVCWAALQAADAAASAQGSKVARIAEAVQQRAFQPRTHPEPTYELIMRVACSQRLASRQRAANWASRPIAPPRASRSLRLAVAADSSQAVIKVRGAVLSGPRGLAGTQEAGQTSDVGPPVRRSLAWVAVAPMP